MTCLVEMLSLRACLLLVSFVLYASTFLRKLSRFAAGTNTVAVLLGNGTGGFGAATGYATGPLPTSVAVTAPERTRPAMVVASQRQGSVVSSSAMRPR